MTNYKLNINCSDEDLRIIANAKDRVCLVNHTMEQQSRDQVAWVSFKPWQKNTVEWSNAFEVYAADGEVQSRNWSAFGINNVNTCNEDLVSLMTESGELIAKDMKIPKGVLDGAKNISISYDEVKKEFYLQVE